MYSVSNIHLFEMLWKFLKSGAYCITFQSHLLSSSIHVAFLEMVGTDEGVLAGTPFLTMNLV